MTKTGIDAVYGIVASIITYLIGGWNGIIGTLVLFMILDYITGIVVAAFFHTSSKTESGGLSSKAGFVGLVKKIAIMIIVVVAYHVDTIMQLNGILLMATEYGFIANEGISILENISKMGIKLPAKLVAALDVLSKKEDEDAS